MTTVFKCHNCGKRLRAQESHRRKQAVCPSCGHSLIVPAKRLPSRDAFVSYATPDKSTADAVCAALERAGIRCWIAPRDITPGKQYAEAIIDGIDQCRTMVVIFSRHSNLSAQVVREVERAVSKTLIIIPFRIEDIPPTKSMEYFLSSPHWLDALIPPLETHLHALTQTINSLLQADNTPPSASPSSSLPLPAGTAPCRLTSLTQLLGKLGPAWPAVTAGVLLMAVLLLTVLPSVLRRFAHEQDRDTVTPKHPAVAGPLTAARSPQPAMQLCETTLRTGKLTFHTETFRLVKAPRKAVTSPAVDQNARQDEGDEVEMRFQLANRSDQLITLASLTVTELGQVVLVEDRVSISGPMHFSTRPSTRRGSLGRVQFAWAENGEGSTDKGDLLDGETLETVEPSMLRSFLLRLQCTQHQELLFTQDLVLDGKTLQSEGFDVSEFGDGPGDHRFGRECLLRKVAHVFVITIDVLAEDGQRARLYSDWIYALLPEIQKGGETHALSGPSDFEIDRPQPVRKDRIGSRLRESFALPPDELTRQLVDCFVELRSAEPRTRSNLVEVLHTVAKEHPRLWELMDKEIAKLATVDDGVLNRKAKLLEQQLTEPSGKEETSPFFDIRRAAPELKRNRGSEP